MYIDRQDTEAYKYDGVFYRVTIDESKPLIEQTEEEVVIYQTKCDIMESSHSWSNNFIWAKYAVFFPFDVDSGETLLVRMGDLFKADMYGLNVNGKVVGVFPSQLGGVVAYIQDSDV
jgi:hypothetical protein